MSAMRHDDLLHERESEAGTAARLRVGKLRAVVRIENAREVFCIDADAAIFHFDHDGVGCLTKRDFDRLLVI